MRPVQLYASGLFLMMVTATQSPAAAQVVAPGPYYALPSWAQKLRCDTRATCPRFIVLSDWNHEAVLDRETGLVWQRSPSVEQVVWRTAKSRCIALIVDGRLSWRLPTFNELASLVDVAAPALPPGHPFTSVQPAVYHSSTAARELLASTTIPFVLGMHLGAVGNQPWVHLIQDSQADASKRHYWCVRGPLSTQIE